MKDTFIYVRIPTDLELMELEVTRPEWKEAVDKAAQDDMGAEIGTFQGIRFVVNNRLRP